MKKILGIVGSKRKSGNCEIVVKEISRRLAFPNELQLLRLPDFELRHCTGCYRCLAGDKGCVLKDDLAQVLETIAGADALILAAPTYFLGAHACLKVLIDRGISFYGMSDRLWGKAAIGVGLAGMEGKEGSTHLDIERFFSVLLAKNLRTRILYGALPGEVLLKEENEKSISELAAALSGASPDEEKNCCPICGGETFRFLKDNKIRCMLCSQLGSISFQEGRFHFSMEPSAHQILFSEQSALKHRDWLEGMKKLFRERQGELKEITMKYQNQGTWIHNK